MSAGPQKGEDGCSPSFADRINSYALVTYIPEPLSGFLNRLRREFIPTCFLNAHVTILPPRQLPSSAEAAWHQVRDAAHTFGAFTLELAGVEVFRKTNVIYIGLRRGTSQLRVMHDTLNRADLAFNEPYEYLPHVTLAQDFPVDRLDELNALAQRRWDEFPFERGFRVARVTFVQNTRRNVWIDLGECHLGSREAEVLEPILA